MKIRVAYLLLSSMLLCVTANRLHAEPLRILTEELPPYNYSDRGEVRGLSTEVVRSVMAEAGLEYSIEVTDWTDAYHFARTGANTLLYSIVRNEKRESHFQWVGVIAPISSCLFTHRHLDNPPIGQLTDASAYRVGVSRGTWAEQHLLDLGFSTQKNLLVAPSDMDLWRAIGDGRVDFWLTPVATTNYFIETWSGKEKKDYRSELCIDHSGMELAASRQLSPEIVAALRQSLKKIKADGRFQMILEKYQGMPGQ